MANHRRELASRPGLIPTADSERADDHRAGSGHVMRIVLLLITVAFTGFIAVATVVDMVNHGVTWLDIVALLVVVLFATGICGSLWESIRRG